MSLKNLISEEWLKVSLDNIYDKKLVIQIRRDWEFKTNYSKIPGAGVL